MPRFFIIFLLFICFSLPALAGEFDSLGLSNRDVQIMKEAYRYSKQQDWESARQTARDASDSIVYKIILWREFKEAKSTSSDDIRQFLAQNKDWPLRDQFSRRIGIYTKNPDSKDSWKGIASRSRDLLEAGDYQAAYDNVKGKFNNYNGESRSDALWLAGWIALRFLKDPQSAIAYFDRQYREAASPITKARSAYWAGRAYEQSGNKKQAAAWYAQAARYPTYFYGQLAALRIDDDYVLTLPEYSPPNNIDANNFLADERIRAARLLDFLGDTQNPRLFLLKYLDEQGRTVSDYLLVVMLAQATTNYEWAVLAGKKAAAVEVQIPHANYPVLVYEPQTVEKALMMAIIRQESQLNRYAKSSAGAAGLMQLMPSTADNVAKMAGVDYSYERLFEKDYNMLLGSFYLGKRVKDFNGSYIMAIASYNAGIGNVKTWVGRFGDPRQARSLDEVIDWMESIPFSETRNYVQRVLENLQVYRARLNGNRHKLMLYKDMFR